MSEKRIKKPELKDFIKVVGKVDGKEIGGIDFASYAFALERYIKYLEGR